MSSPSALVRDRPPALNGVRTATARGSRQAHRSKAEACVTSARAMMGAIARLCATAATAHAPTSVATTSAAQVRSRRCRRLSLRGRRSKTSPRVITNSERDRRLRMPLTTSSSSDAGRRQSPTSPELLRRWPAWSMALAARRVCPPAGSEGNELDARVWYAWLPAGEGPCRAHASRRLLSRAGGAARQSHCNFLGIFRRSGGLCNSSCGGSGRPGRGA